jgi:hypothetical protein
MVRTKGHILRRFLLHILLICGLITGHTAVVHAKSPLKPKSLCIERLFDHEQVHLLFIENENTVVEEDAAPLIFRIKRIPPKRRYYLNTTNQASSYTTRFLQLQHNLEFYIPIQENKTGVYQQQRAFLPAYYSFLSRYTPF